MSAEILGLGLSIAALAAGPLLHPLASRSRSGLAAVEGFVLGAVGGIVLLHVLPRVVPISGGAAIGAFLIGFVLPILLHRAHEPTLRRWVAGIGVVAVAAHATLDGAALAGGGETLGVAVVLHRIPAGLFVWLLLRPTYGAVGAAAGLVVVAVATIGGFFAMAGAALHESGFATFEAFVGGALLHVMFGHRRAASGTVAAQVAGGAVGIALALGLFSIH